jgi:hypothetical protein
VKYDYDALSNVLVSNDGLVELVRINFVTLFIKNIKNRMVYNLQVDTSKDKIELLEREE